MSHRDAGQLLAIHFYATAPYQCSYLPDRVARSQVAVPAEAIDSTVYSQLVSLGFRRSGLHTYRPYCDRCQSCISVRIPVDEFHPSRSQRKAFNRLAGVTVCAVPLAFKQEHYELYYRYQTCRHMGGGMSEDNPEQYSEFILKSGVDSLLVEFRLDGVLKMVSLIDRLTDGLSAVYTFYDPEDTGVSYGIFNILWQIEWARQLGLPYVYLGYWVEECRKMSYKAAFRPLEVLRHGMWGRFVE